MTTLKKHAVFSVPCTKGQVLRRSTRIPIVCASPPPSRPPSPSSSENIKSCITCRHSRIACVKPEDREPRIVCSLFVDAVNPVTGEKKYKSALEMRLTGQDDPDACAMEGRLYQAREDDLEMAQFNMFWLAAWTQCMKQK